jgi:hypothetical protein
VNICIYYIYTRVHIKYVYIQEYTVISYRSLYTQNFRKLLKLNHRSMLVGIKLLDVNWNVCLGTDKYRDRKSVV